MVDGFLKHILKIICTGNILRLNNRLQKIFCKNQEAIESKAQNTACEWSVYKWALLVFLRTVQAFQNFAHRENCMPKYVFRKLMDVSNV